jgi:hypothetical protein
MNEAYCAKEQQVSAAICSGQPKPEILAHAQVCPVCSEILRVSHFLQGEAQLAEHELCAMPDAGLIWRKSQALARKEALVRATRPIRLVKACACVVALLAAPWLIFESRNLFPESPDSWIKALSTIAHFWPQSLNQTVVFLGIAGTVVSIVLSSLYVLREN